MLGQDKGGDSNNQAKAVHFTSLSFTNCKILGSLGDLFNAMVHDYAQ